jgi:hypothetical protein
MSLGNLADNPPENYRPNKKGWGVLRDVAPADDNLKRAIIIQWTNFNRVTWLHHN